VYYAYYNQFVRPKKLLRDEGRVKHIAKHKVAWDEVLHVFNNDPVIMTGRGKNIYTALDRTDGGRFLLVPYRVDSEGNGFIFTARPMDAAEKRLYKKKGGK